MPTTRHRHPVLTLVCTLLTLLILLPAKASQPALASTTSATATLNTWQTAGPYGGTLSSVAVDPTTPSTIFAGARGGNIFKSTDRGNNWNTVYRNPGNYDSNTYILEILVAPTLHTTLYARSNYGIQRSTDGGNNWTFLSSTSSKIGANSAFAVDPSDPTGETLYLGYDERGLTTSKSPWKSTNGGDTWNALPGALPGVCCSKMLIDPTNPQQIYVAAAASNILTQTDDADTIYRSIDGGTTWQPFNTGLPKPTIDPNTKKAIVTAKFATLALSLLPNTIGERQVYASVYGYDSQNHISSESLYTIGVSGGSWIKIADSYQFNSLLFDPSNQQHMYASVIGNPQVYESSNGGSQWTPKNPIPSPNIEIQNIALDPNDPRTLYSATNDGIYRSTDGGDTWAQINNNLLAGYVESLAVDPFNPKIMFAGTPRGLLKTVDGGTTWVLKSADIIMWQHRHAIAFDPSNPQILYAGSGKVDKGGVYKSDNDGETWTKLAGQNLPDRYIEDLTVDPFHPGTLFLRMSADKPGIYKSVDDGKSWSVISAAIDFPNPDPFYYFYSFNALAVDPQNSATLYVSIDKGMYKTTDGGLHWRALTVGLPQGQGVWVQALAIDPLNSSTIFASIGDVIYRSKDAGESWLKVIDNVFCRDLLIDLSNHTTIYASILDGILRSTDGGDTWQSFTNRETVRNDATLAVVPSSPIRIVAATRGNGVYTLDFSIAGVSVETPRGVVAGQPFTARATVLQLNGTTETSYNGPVSLQLKGAVLSGTAKVQAVNGVATFPNLIITTAGTGYSLSATAHNPTSAGELASGHSQPFSVVTTAQGVVRPEQEPNDQLSQATPLVFDANGAAIYTGTITSTRDIDVYTVATLPGADISVQLRDLPADYNLLLLADPDAASNQNDGADLGNVSDIGQWSIGQWSIGQWSIASSENNGLTADSIQTTLARGGRYYLVVYGANGAHNAGQTYTLSVKLQDGTLANPVVNAQFGRGMRATRDDTVETIFLTNFKRIDQRYPADATSRATLKGQLANTALLNASEGVVLDISQGQDPAASDRLDALYTRWDAAADQPLLANEAAQQIWNILDRAIVTHYPNTENIVIVGGDDIIPFYRVPDDTDLGNERDYGRALEATGAFKSNTPLGGSLRYSFFQTDDFYADRKPTPWRGRQLFMPDQAIGRLVETPADIVTYLNSYIASQSYTINATGSAALVTGYGFLSDEGRQIGETLNGFSDPGHGVIKVTELLSDEWDLNLLNSIWFGGELGSFSGTYQGIQTPFSLSSLNSHFTHFDLIPARPDGGVFDAQRIYTPTPATAAGGYFKRSGSPTLLYSVGCHSGLSASDGAFSDPRYQADFAQAVLKQGGNWIGNTGYGIGDSDVVGYSERLALLFTRNLGRKISVNTPYDGASIGESLALAKRQYLQTSGPNGFGLFDEKIMNEMTLYGLPFIRVKVPNPQSVASETPSFPDSVRPTLTASEGLFTRVITITTEFAPLSGSNSVPLIQSWQVQDEFSATPRELIVTTSTGRDRPVLPALVYDLSLAANDRAGGVGSPEVRGVRLRSATTLPDVANFDPHVTAPITDQIALGGSASRPLTNIGEWQPALPYTFQRTARVTPGGEELVGGRPGDVTDKLIVIPAQVRADNAQTGRLRRFHKMVFEVTYVDPRTASDAVRTQTSGPAFERVEIVGSVKLASGSDPSKVELRASLSPTASPAAQVSATYSVAGSAWRRIVLPRGSDGAYHATITADAASDVSAFFEAIDRAGNVAVAGRADTTIRSYSFLPVIGK